MMPPRGLILIVIMHSASLGLIELTMRTFGLQTFIKHAIQCLLLCIVRIFLHSLVKLSTVTTICHVLVSLRSFAIFLFCSYVNCFHDAASVQHVNINIYVIVAYQHLARVHIIAINFVMSQLLYAHLPSVWVSEGA